MPETPMSSDLLTPPENNPRRFTSKVWAILIVTLLYILPAFALSLDRGNQEFVMYVAVLVLLMAAVLLLHRMVGLHLLSLWGLSLWGFLHMAGGLTSIPDSWPVNTGEPAVLYNWWILPGFLKFDQAVHAYGFGLTTWICWQALCRAFANRGVTVRPSFGLLVLCAAGGMGFGAVNEVVEFAATVLVPETNVGGYENTGWDLVANLVGSAVAVTLIWAMSRNTGERSPI